MRHSLWQSARRSHWFGLGAAVGVSMLLSIVRGEPQPVSGRVPLNRPLVSAKLVDGSQIAGNLERFAGGIYTVRSNGKFLSFNEADARELEFRNQPESPETRTDAIKPRAAIANAAEIERLIQQFCRETNHPEGGRRAIDPALIPRLAAQGSEAIRPLLSAYKQKRCDDYQAIGEVLKQMGPEVLPQLLEAFRQDADNFWHPAWYAYRELGLPAAPAVRAMLTDPDARVRKLAMDVLYSWSSTSGAIVPRSFDKDLIAVLDDPSDAVRQQAPSILGRIGSRSELVLPALAKTMTDNKYAPIRGSTIGALGYIGGGLKADHADFIQVLQLLSDAVVADDDPHVRSYAAYYIGTFGHKAEPTVPALLKASDDSVEYVRKNANEALLKVGAALDIALRKKGIDDPQLLKAIRQVAGAEEAGRQSAVTSLAAAGPENLDALLIAIRLDHENRYWNLIASVFSKWGVAASPKLLAAVRIEKEMRVRRAIAMALGHLPFESVPAELRSLLRDPEHWVRMTSLESIAQLSRRGTAEMLDSAVACMKDALTDESLDLRRKAVDELANVGPAHPDVIPLLLKTLQRDQDPTTRRDAAYELGHVASKLNPRSADFPRIISALTDAIERDRSDDVRTYAISALSYLGPKAAAAIPTLRKAEDDPIESVAKHARETLRKISAPARESQSSKANPGKEPESPSVEPGKP